MGMFPYNVDVAQWTKVLNQGMNAFDDLDSEVEIQQDYKMIDGWKAFMTAQVRSAKQVAAKFYFNDDEKMNGKISY